MTNDIKYIAKQILTLSKIDNVIAFSCLAENESKVKNADFQQIVEVLKTSGINFTVVNYDATYSGAIDIDATKICDNFSYNFDNIDIPEGSVVLVNLKSILGNEELLDSDGKIKKIVLSSKYGKTSFNSLEKGAEILKQNKIEVIGIIANKR